MNTSVRILDEQIIEYPGVNKPGRYTRITFEWEDERGVHRQQDILKSGCTIDTPHRRKCGNYGFPVSMTMSCLCKPGWVDDVEWFTEVRDELRALGRSENKLMDIYQKLAPGTEYVSVPERLANDKH